MAGNTLSVLFAEAAEALQKRTISKEEQQRNQSKLRENNGYDFGIPQGMAKSSTYNKNLQICKRFLRYTKSNHPELEYLTEFYPYVTDYLDHQKEKNGRNSVKREGQAIARMYGCSFSDFNYFLERKPREKKKVYNPIAELDVEKVQGIREMALAATGLAIKELPYLTRDCIYEKEGRLWLKLSSCGERPINPRLQPEFRKYWKEKSYISGNTYQLFPKELFIGFKGKNLINKYYTDLYIYYAYQEEKPLDIVFGRLSPSDSIKLKGSEFRYSRDTVEKLMKYSDEESRHVFVKKYLTSLSEIKQPHN